jgi:hypothetical protein
MDGRDTQADPDAAVRLTAQELQGLRQELQSISNLLAGI